MLPPKPQEESMNGHGLGERGSIAITLLAALMLGSGYVVIKSGLGGIDPFLFSAVTVGIGGLIALGYTLSRGTFTWRIFTYWEAWAGMTVTFALLASQYVGLSMTKASIGGLIVGGNVIVVALLSAFLFREHLTRGKVAALAMGLVGLFIITTKLDVGGLTEEQLIGDMLLVITSVCVALTIVLSKLALRRMTFDQFVLSLHLFTPLPLLAVYALFGHPTQIQAVDLQYILYIGIVCTAVPTLLYVKALESISPVMSSAMTLTESTFAAVLGILVLNDQLDIFVVVGAALVFLSILLVTRRTTANDGNETQSTAEP
ncbi:MAG: DMT family transporter [Methanomassiliicoccales archaeon]|nr:DMT family transporter [Methanomassiliicoccales archaeon]